MLIHYIYSRLLATGVCFYLLSGKEKNCWLLFWQHKIEYRHLHILHWWHGNVSHRSKVPILCLLNLSSSIERFNHLGIYFVVVSNRNPSTSTTLLWLHHPRRFRAGEYRWQSPNVIKLLNSPVLQLWHSYVRKTDSATCLAKSTGKTIASDKLINAHRKYRIENVDSDSNWTWSSGREKI